MTIKRIFLYSALLSCLTTNAIAEVNKFLNISCYNGSRGPGTSINPHNFLIRHTSNNTADLIVYIEGGRYEQALILYDQSIESSETNFNYRERNYDVFLDKSMFTNRFVIDRTRGILIADVVPKKPPANLNYPPPYIFQCKQIKDRTYESLEYKITQAKILYLTQRKNEADKKMNEIKSQRAF
jgi:tetratricopeptide (TPR) repeat protein